MINIENETDDTVITNMKISGEFLSTYGENDSIIEKLHVKHIDESRINKWSYVIDNKESFLKCGVELLTLAIKVHNLHLMEKIYNKCMDYFEEDVTNENNKMFLNIITSTMPLLDKYYPEYITRYSLDTDMIIDSPSYCIKHNTNSPHLYSFCSPEPRRSKLYKILKIFVRKLEFSATRSIPKITFMVPYIKFVNYPQDYNWWMEFFLPQPSLFAKLINSKEIYRTWGGEALINFKWDTFGIFYLYIIYLGYSFLFAFFFSLAYYAILLQDNSENKSFYIISIVLGSIFLSIEVRKFIYKIYYIQSIDVGNIINITMYSLLIYVLPKLPQTNEREIDGLLSFLCLFLTFRVLSVLVYFTFYFKYYAIVVNVGKQVFLFLVIFVLAMIVSFATAFYVLLSPKLPYSLDERTVNNDPNNPWNLAHTYQAFENENDTKANLYIIQTPDENTNMFANFGIAMFAIFSFFTGDTSVLSNWSYQNNWALTILMTLFISLTTIFILNVFIGLFSEAMNFDVKASILMTKAEFLAEVEMFYLFPFQRRWKKWFPEVLYYHADINKTREKINQMINDNKEWTEWYDNKFSEMKQDLLKTLEIKNPQDNETLLREILRKVEKLENKIV